MTSTRIPSSPPRLDPNDQKLLWTSVARATLPCGGPKGSSSSSGPVHFKDAPITILAEAGDDPFGGAVAQTARELLAKKATAGWEYHTQNSTKKGPLWNRKTPEPANSNNVRLKGIKFHLYDNSNATLDQHNGDMLLWVFSAVYNPQAAGGDMDQAQCKAFLEKLIVLTELYRDTDDTWRTGPTLSCQQSFAPILQQRLQEVSYQTDHNAKLRAAQDQLHLTKSAMHDNIQMILQREEQLNDLKERTTHLEDMAHDFQKRSKVVREKMMWQNAKHGVLVGSAISGVVAIVVVPPLVALL